jgi:hypothetical protein
MDCLLDDQSIARSLAFDSHRPASGGISVARRRPLVTGDLHVLAGALAGQPTGRLLPVELVPTTICPLGLAGPICQACVLFKV